MELVIFSVLYFYILNKYIMKKMEIRWMYSGRRLKIDGIIYLFIFNQLKVASALKRNFGFFIRPCVPKNANFSFILKIIYRNWHMIYKKMPKFTTLDNEVR